MELARLTLELSRLPKALETNSGAIRIALES
jgi:hypothetical protein